MNRGKPQFSPAEIARIREESDSGVLSPRAWALAKGVSVETVRRVARRETYADGTSRGLPTADPHSGPPSTPEPTAGEMAASLEKLNESLSRIPTKGKAERLIDEMMNRRKGDST
jgi:hypothetical protein